MKAFLAILFFSLAFIGCNSESPNNGNADGEPAIVPEAEPTEILLAPPYDSKEREYSGLTVFDDKLILLPQYFLGFDKDTVGHIYSIEFSRIEEYLNGTNKNPITPDSITVFGNGLQRFNHRGSGYEAITFIENRVYISIEAIGSPTATYLVSGIYNQSENSIRLDSATLTELPQQTDIRNYGYETIVKCNGAVIAINELNGVNNVNSPEAFVYSSNLQNAGFLRMQHIEYRITDATNCEGNYFWAINYFWPGDTQEINPGEDFIALKYGIGAHQTLKQGIERILKFEVRKDSVVVASAPIYIEPENSESSNWEGIAKYKDGFILVTDTYPRTRLVFVKGN